MFKMLAKIFELHGYSFSVSTALTTLTNTSTSSEGADIGWLGGVVVRALDL